MKDNIENLMDKIFTKGSPSDIVKGVAYYQGEASVGAETKHKTLVAMVILSDSPIASEKQQEIIFMGATNGLVDRINSYQKFEPPHCLGTISSAILQVSEKMPTDLDPL